LVERELEAIRSEAVKMPSHHGMLTALRFYLRRLLTDTCNLWSAAANGVTNHVHLPYQLRVWQAEHREPIALVSFNYDTMLDSASVDALGLTFPNVDSYVTNDNFKIIKPHGSVNRSIRLNRTTTFANEEDVFRELVQIAPGIPSDLSDDYRITPDFTDMKALSGWSDAFIVGGLGGA
jgi:hypothetical protein